MGLSNNPKVEGQDNNWQINEVFGLENQANQKEVGLSNNPKVVGQNNY